MAVCKKVTYSGRVQGVGFRYAARRLAAALPVGGYVKNLPNGKVELRAEGEAAAVDEFLARVAQRMAGYIVHVETRDEPPQGFDEFDIAY
jgi:acylphosphatase